MSELSYPLPTLRGDYVRSALGLLLTLGPSLAIPLSSPANLVLLPGACLFAAFTFRTWRRHQSRVLVNDGGISISGGGGASLAWPQVRSVTLSYFSTRRDHSGGWMQLKIRGDDPLRPDRSRTIRLDSTLDGFTSVARQAAAAVAANRLTVSEATRANFAALGIEWLEASPVRQAMPGHAVREPG